jgi:hypothetical protein
MPMLVHQTHAQIQPLAAIIHKGNDMETIAAITSLASVLVGSIITVTVYIVTIKVEQKSMRGEVRKLWEKTDCAAVKQAQNDLDILGVCKDIQFIKETLVEIKDRLTGDGK